MTQAVCFNCGEIKFGAFTPCKYCQVTPSTDGELALSLSMTDHYLDADTMEEMSRAIKTGSPPVLDGEMLRGLVDQLDAFRNSGLFAWLTPDNKG